MTTKVSALIAVRSGSVRIKNKNMRNFNNSTLLELKIKQLQEIKEIDEIVVNSNSDDMLNTAASFGVTTVKRDNYYASNTINMSDVYKNMADNIDCDVILYANCTSPLVNNKSYIGAINTFFQKTSQYDSVVSCHEIKEFMYLNNIPINYDPLNQPRSQDLPDIVALNFAFSVVSKLNMINNRNIIGKNPFFYKIDEVESIDIDTPLDFFIAESLYKRMKLEKKPIL